MVLQNISWPNLFTQLGLVVIMHACRTCFSWVCKYGAALKTLNIWTTHILPTFDCTLLIIIPNLSSMNHRIPPNQFFSYIFVSICSKSWRLHPPGNALLVLSLLVKKVGL